MSQRCQVRKSESFDHLVGLSLKEALNRGSFSVRSSRRQFYFPDGRRLAREVLPTDHVVLCLPDTGSAEARVH